MADHSNHRIVEPAATPRHYTPPSVRDLRSQSIHRLQVGLLGLCTMLLLVGLANVIMDRAMLSEDKDAATEQAIAADADPQKPAADPLADIGVQPTVEPTPDAGSQPDAPTDSLVND